MIQLHIDWVPVKIIAYAAAGLVHMLAIAEGAPGIESHLCSNALKYKRLIVMRSLSRWQAPKGGLKHYNDNSCNHYWQEYV